MRGSRALLLSGILGLSLSASATTQSGRAHLLLVTVDTLRADNLSAYGAREGATPNLDELGKLGVLFEDAISVIGKTGPSFATTFTSLYPPTHGARRNSVRLRSDVPVWPRFFAAPAIRRLPSSVTGPSRTGSLD